MTEEAGGLVQMTRRRFLGGALFLAGATAAGALAGCGGGGGSSNTPGDRFNGSYQGRDILGNGDLITASVSIDGDGTLTFWSLLNDSNGPFLDYGQVSVDSGGNFSQSLGGITTFGQVRNGRISGRTQYDANTSDGFDWQASRYRPGGSHPSDDQIGSFEGFTQLNGIEYTTLLTVAPDGTATFFGSYDNPNTDGVDYFVVQGIHFDRNGNVPTDDDYFLQDIGGGPIYGDRFALRSSGTDSVRLEFTFGADASQIGILAGDRVDFVMSRVFGRSVMATQAAVRRSAVTDPRRIMTANTPALQRMLAALRKG